MTDPPAAFAEPSVPARRTWLGAIMIACLGVWAGFMGPIQVLLGLQAATFSPQHKEATLALVAGLGAFVSTFTNPLAGALSDRTTARRDARSSSSCAASSWPPRR